jgi:hypothetical protein
MAHEMTTKRQAGDKEAVGNFQNSSHSPPRRGGEDARSNQKPRSYLFRADGVVSSAAIQAFAGLTTPAAP